VRALGPKALLLLAVVAGVSLPGCGVLDRPRYSLVIRKPAHRYRELTEVEREELELYERTRVSRSPAFRDSVSYEPFRPFRYCHVHDSYHVPESMVACAVAPVEYPTAIGAQLGTILVVGLGRQIGALGERVGEAAVYAWESVFPPRPEPPVEPEPEEERAARRND
jgi:hypothetical protein